MGENVYSSRTAINHPLYPKLNGYGEIGQRSLKLWQLLHTYWLPNTYWNWQEYVVSVMLIFVLNMELTYEWHKAIKLNYINTRTNAIVVLRVPSILHGTWIAGRIEVLAYLLLTPHFGISLLHNWTQSAGRWLNGYCTCPADCVSWSGTVRGTARRPQFSLAIISVTVQLWI